MSLGNTLGLWEEEAGHLGAGASLATGAASLLSSFSDLSLSHSINSGLSPPLFYFPGTSRWVRCLTGPVSCIPHESAMGADGNYPHFTELETGAQKGWDTDPGSHGQ